MNAVFGKQRFRHQPKQLLVSGATRILFTCGDGTEPPAHCWYESNPERRAALIAGWRQFAADLAAYGEFARNVLQDLPGVTELHSSFSLKSLKDQRKLPLAGN